MLKLLEKTHHQAGPVTPSFLVDQVAALLCYDPSVRSGGQDASSAMSAAADQVSSVLADRRLFDRAEVDELRAELAWLSAALGPLSHVPPARKQTDPYEPAYETAYDTALAALESERYFRLVAGLQKFCSAPPVRQPRRRHLYAD